jgi:hypothetical protein
MATFTRKHFRMTAENLAMINNKADRENQIAVWCQTFKKANPRFSSATFCDYIEQLRIKALKYKGEQVAKEYQNLYA